MEGVDATKNKEEFALAKAQILMPLSATAMKKEYVICDMCGHANPAPAAICKMCSNYLTKEGK